MKTKSKINYEKFDYEKFDYDKCYNEIVKNIKKPNIMLCGGTGVGKSSLINDIFNLKIMDNVGTEGKPKTRGIKRYSIDDSTVNLYDTEGYEIGNVTSLNDKYYKDIIGFIEKKRKEFPAKMEEHIHEVWYCISAGNKRFCDIDIKIINEIIKNKVPIMIIITKVETIDENELGELASAIKKEFNDIEYYTYSIKKDCFDEETLKKYVQKEEMLNWAINNLDESLVSGFIPAVRENIKTTREYIIKSYIPRYTEIAAVSVAGMSVVNIPLSDSVVLMGLQMKMLMSIIKAYGIKTELGNTIKNLAATNLVSYIGKTLASQLISIIPFIGGVSKAIVNVSVAASVTAVLGASIALICEKYLEACVDNNGSENLKFEDFISKDEMKKAITYVKAHMSEFNLNETIEMAQKKKNKGKSK